MDNGGMDIGCLSLQSPLGWRRVWTGGRFTPKYPSCPETDLPGRSKGRVFLVGLGGVGDYLSCLPLSLWLSDGQQMAWLSWVGVLCLSLATCLLCTLLPLCPCPSLVLGTIHTHSVYLCLPYWLVLDDVLCLSLQ